MFALLVVLLVWRPQSAARAAGALDISFGTDGATTVDLRGTGNSEDTTVDIEVDSSGRIVLLGDIDDGFGVARIGADGLVDTSFAADGALWSAAVDTPRGLVLTSDGGFVVGASGTGALVVAQFTVGGVVTTIVDQPMGGAASGGHDVVVVGSQLVVLAADGGNLQLRSYSLSGALSATWVTSAVPGESNELLWTGSHYLFTGDDAGGRGGIFRVDADGTDPVAFVHPDHEAWALARQANGRLVYAGRYGPDDNVLVARLFSSGLFDTSFGIGGVQSFSAGGINSPAAKAVAIQTDGKIVVAGSRRDLDSSIFVARLTSLGALDTTFGTAGVLTFPTVAGQDTLRGDAVALQSSGRIVVGGDVNNTSRDAAVGDVDLLAFRISTTTSGASTTTTSSTTTVPGQTPAGGTARSDPAGTVPSATNRVVATVTTPKAGPVTFSKASLPDVAGFRSIGGVTITAPAATPAAPLLLSFQVDVSTLPTSYPPSGVAILKNGTAVAPCTGAVAAAPDPCVVSRVRSGSQLTATVRSSSASTWMAARPIVDRLGNDVSASIAASRSAFPDGTAAAAVLARDDDFADALAATPLAAAKRGPLLLTSPGSLDDAVLTELTRVLPTGATVYLLGGTSALSPAVEQRVESWGYTTVRYAGVDRYATAVEVAERALGSPTTVIETTGLNHADAVAAGAAATRVGGAVLLTSGSRQTSSTARYLAEVRPVRYALGGPATLADPAATALAGRDRYETSVLAAKRFFTTPAAIGVAPGYSFAEALPGGAHAALSGSPLLLLPSSGELPVSVSIYLRELESAPPTAFVYGGTAAIDDAVVALLRAALGG